ncbi:hypothetical protein QJQ45_024994 [Haematococcus lacustris]|nr:hypothetical protein QJQ45_024994 [Haematococcus lacustris]
MLAFPGSSAKDFSLNILAADKLHRSSSCSCSSYQAAEAQQEETNESESSENSKQPTRPYRFITINSKPEQLPHVRHPICFPDITLQMMRQPEEVMQEIKQTGWTREVTFKTTPNVTKVCTDKRDPPVPSLATPRTPGFATDWELELVSGTIIETGEQAVHAVCTLTCRSLPETQLPCWAGAALPAWPQLEIKAFLTDVYGMEVERVATINYLGRKFTVRRHKRNAGFITMRADDWKKAYVTFARPGHLPPAPAPAAPATTQRMLATIRKYKLGPKAKFLRHRLAAATAPAALEGPMQLEA